MLVLKRKKGERIILQIGEVKILVGVAELRGDKVMLGIDAPEEVSIYREEIWEKRNAAALTT